LVDKDGNEYILEINDTAIGLMNSVHDEDSGYIKDLVLERMETELFGKKEKKIKKESENFVIKKEVLKIENQKNDEKINEKIENLKIIDEKINEKVEEKINEKIDEKIDEKLIDKNEKKDNSYEIIQINEEDTNEIDSLQLLILEKELELTKLKIKLKNLKKNN
jgi:DNA mismatch repair ATPase MutS